MRIIIADNQRKVRYALRVLLEKQPDTTIIGETSSAVELLNLIEKKHPDTLLVDWQLTEGKSQQAFSAYRKLCPELSIIAMSGRPENERIAIDSGADAFISKIDPLDRLLVALRAMQSDQKTASAQDK